MLLLLLLLLAASLLLLVCVCRFLSDASPAAAPSVAAGHTALNQLPLPLLLLLLLLLCSLLQVFGGVMMS
jgi:hypothetical protein